MKLYNEQLYTLWKKFFVFKMLIIFFLYDFWRFIDFISTKSGLYLSDTTLECAKIYGICIVFDTVQWYILFYPSKRSLGFSYFGFRARTYINIRKRADSTSSFIKTGPCSWETHTCEIPVHLCVWLNGYR